MKKTSIALIIGLFAVGCEKAPQKISPSAPAPDPATMAAHMGAAGGAPKAEDKKEEATEEKKEEAKPEAAAPTEPAPAEEKKE